MQLLLHSTAETLAGHLDRIFAHNRRLKARGRLASRAWYLPAEAWVAGTAAAPTDEGSRFFEEEVLPPLCA